MKGRYFVVVVPQTQINLFSLSARACCKDCSVWQKTVCRSLVLRTLNMAEACVWVDQEELNKVPVEYSF